jgi:3-hydroxyisobutyrate dehydrogenase
MGTISPAQSREIFRKVKAAGGDYMECPVLGSKNEARASGLILMAGATPGQFKKWRRLLACLGPKPQLIGPVGRAAALKLALNQLIASHAACFSLSLGLVVKSGIDAGQFMDILGDSALTSPMYAKKLPNWLKRTYAHPNFTLKHMLKDVDLILSEAERLKLNASVLAAIRKNLKRAAREGWEASDYSAVYEVINKK